MTAETKERFERILADLSNRMGIPAPATTYRGRGGGPKAVDDRRPGRIEVPPRYLGLPLPDPEMEGVVAHELTHISERHLWKRRASAIGSYFGTEVIILGLLFLRYLRADVFLIMVVILPLGTFLLVAIVVSWHYEYRADAGAAQVIDGEFLAQALERFKELESRRSLWRRLTHPSTEKRIERLRESQSRGAIRPV